MFFSSSWLSLLSQKAPIPEDAQRFLRPYSFFFFSLAPRFAAEFLLLARKQQVSAMILGFSSFIVAAILGYLLGFQWLDLMGLGLAFGIGGALTLLAFGARVYTSMSKEFFSRHLWFSWGPEDKRQIIYLARQAVPTFFSFVSDFAATLTVSFFAGLLAATKTHNPAQIWNAAATLLTVTLLIGAAGALGTSGQIAEQMGEAKISVAHYPLIKKAFIGGVCGTIAIQLPFIILFCAAPQMFIRILGGNNNDQDSSVAHNAIYLAAAYAVIDGIRYNALQSLRSLSDNLTASVISSVSLWLGVSVSYILSRYMESDSVLGLPLGLIGGATLSTLILAPRIWKRVTGETLLKTLNNPVSSNNAARANFSNA